MTHAESRLLLFLEACCVDHAGALDMRQINAGDLTILASWERSGVLRRGRIRSSDIRSQRTQWVRLTPEFQSKAADLRAERAERMWQDRAWQTTSEIHGDVEA